MFGVVQRVIAALGFTRVIEASAEASGTTAVTAHPVTTVPAAAFGLAWFAAGVVPSQAHGSASGAASSASASAWATLVGYSAEAFHGPSELSAAATHVHVGDGDGWSGTSATGTLTQVHLVDAAVRADAACGAFALLVSVSASHSHFVSSFGAVPDRTIVLHVPTVTVTAGSSRMLSRATLEWGQTLVVRDGGFELVQEVDGDYLAGADAVFVGGYRHQLNEAEYALLVAAGAEHLVEITDDVS